jgi:hypothetical protein
VATAVGAVLAMVVVFFGSSDAAAFSWFIGAFLSFGTQHALSRRAAATTTHRRLTPPSSSTPVRIAKIKAGLVSPSACGSAGGRPPGAG